MTPVVLRLRWVERDPYRRVLVLVLWGAAGALALALVGLPPLDIHGPAHRVGIMDPFCGMTRAVRLFARGDLDGAWRYNPASFALAALAAAVVLRAGIGVVSGRWLQVEVVHRRLAMAALAVPVAVLWINQQAHVALLR